MNITIIGLGNIGKSLARILEKTAHRVTGVTKGDDLAAAVETADIVIFSTPFDAAADIVDGADFAGKIVVDLSNPVTADFSGLQLGHESSAAEELAHLLPNARVVKAFNTIFADHYALGLKINGTPLQTFIATDDDAARDTIKALAAEIGLEPRDAGPLKNARYLEPLGFMNIQFGYVLGQGPAIAPHWLAA